MAQGSTGGRTTDGLDHFWRSACRQTRVSRFLFSLASVFQACSFQLGLTWHPLAKTIVLALVPGLAFPRRGPLESGLYRNFERRLISFDESVCTGVATMKLSGRSLQVCRVEACRECLGPSRSVDILSEVPTECQYTNFHAKCCHCKMQNVATPVYTVFAEVSWYTLIRTYDDVK